MKVFQLDLLRFGIPPRSISCSILVKTRVENSCDQDVAFNVCLFIKFLCLCELGCEAVLGVISLPRIRMAVNTKYALTLGLWGSLESATTDRRFLKSYVCGI
jgi:hypothetical protein